MEVTILMPCLNEVETLETCIRKANTWMERSGVAGEVLVADNGSTDGSREIALRCGARVEPIATRGYGAALAGGILAAKGRFVIMGDADDSYDFSNLDPFLAALRGGADLVMGNRFAGGIESGAMPKLHYYLGNPVLTAIGRLLFKSPCRDFHCGLRGFRRASVLTLDLRTTGMEFASEMVVKATLAKQRIIEVPTTLKKDGRTRPPHLRSWRDGWRHLRFLLMYSPRWLFALPGVLLLSLGTLLMVWLAPKARVVGGISFDIHTMLAASACMILGFQAVVFAFLTKVFAISEGLLPEDPQLQRAFRYITLETGLLAGIGMLFFGLGCCAAALLQWQEAGFSHLEPTKTMRLFIPGVTATVLGAQAILASFYLSILGLRRKG
ncbi:MAG: glycosyltransferase family 2 protein [Opitutaceae bacterium]|nr:glycosyltransferase family 2 protein [Opitutaceae bacterium]